MEFLKKLFSHTSPQKDDGPFAWGKELDAMDDISAIEYATAQFNADSKKDLSQVDVFKEEQYLNALFAIDEKVHTFVKKITTHYLNIENMSIELEERFANAVFLYHRQLYLIYTSLIDHLAPFQSTFLNLMLARALNNATQMIKWRFYNYQSAPANVWLQLSKLYLVAEKHDLLENQIAAYPDQEVTSLSSSYIQACMLGSLESLSFHRKQIELVSKMLACWTPKILIEKNYNETKHLFYVDTNTDAAAKRIRNFKPTDSCRYWCFDSVNLKVELCLSLLEFNITPKQQEMKDFISDKYAQATLETIKSEWSRVEYKRQRRATERVKTSKYANVTYGFETTSYHIQQQENIRVQRLGRAYKAGKSLEERLATQTSFSDTHAPNIIYMDLGSSQSKIIDESQQGIGIYTNKPASEVTLGMLLGITAEDQKNSTKIGVIRSIKPVIGNELHIGIELLSTDAFSVITKNVSLSNAAKNKNSLDSNHTSGPIITRKEFNEPVAFNSVKDDVSKFYSIYLPKELCVSRLETAQCETLIVPRLHYNKNDTYKIRIEDADIFVKFTDTLEYHDNWLRVAYTQVPEAQGLTMRN